MTNKADIGVIGGSGLYNMQELNNAHEVTIDTPFGKPSHTFRIGEIAGKKIVFLPRHGSHHTILPSEIPHRANIYAMKTLGVRWLISVSAVGSLKKSLAPGHFVFPDQFADRTKQHNEHSFFDDGIVAHISFAKPICTHLQKILYKSSQAMGALCHLNGTYLNMEGPAFSTHAESEMHRRLGFSVVGMTNLAEAKLAREAEISYATIAMVTDYDAWNEEEVTATDVLQTLQRNAELARKSVVHSIRQLDISEKTPCHTALDTALVTPRSHWNEQQTKKLKPILERFL